LTAEELTTQGQGQGRPLGRNQKKRPQHGVPLRCTEFSLSEYSVWRVPSLGAVPKTLLLCSLGGLRELCVELSILRVSRRNSGLVVGEELQTLGNKRHLRVDSSRLQHGSPRGQSVDSTTVIRQAARSKKQRHAEFKGLTGQVSGERRTRLFGGRSGFPDHRNVGMAIY